MSDISSLSGASQASFLRATAASSSSATVVQGSAGDTSEQRLEARSQRQQDALTTGTQSNTTPAASGGRGQVVDVYA
ncbi:hypothetical protein EOI86_12870 [Hwanghaeella grinnelliae]|uniref:Uncharacterized protein n=1 Tax=Hwanghaeella grinnelliae TaxID=2500179 RepID=A0A437QNK2_9PROT|nr:hypothetical protein [Hwanghaeella grinnelliae]RVU36116.1 hypothetical protein EOI86_12870 [Hwanghaeella grinnelliae]